MIIRSPRGREKIAASLQIRVADARQKPKDLVAALGIQPGMTVADVGSGRRLHAAVPERRGRSERARVSRKTSIPDFLEGRKARDGAEQCRHLFWGMRRARSLPADSQDLILVLDAYHHFNYPEAMLASLRQALKPEGRLAVVEYHKNEEVDGRDRPGARAHPRCAGGVCEGDRGVRAPKLVEVKDFVPEVQWMGIFRAAVSLQRALADVLGCFREPCYSLRRGG